VRRRQRPVPATKEIKMYFHCGLCVEEIKALAKHGPVSPREYAELEAGWTELGLQIWCKRHEVNVLHIDFEGQKHPANMDRLDPEEDDHAEDA